jgi:hypothetical protein
VLSVLDEPEDEGWAEEDELLDGEDESELEPDVLPAPAEPLGEVELDDEDGVLLEEPPLALSFFCRSTEVDEELEPEGVALEDGELDDGELVVPEAELEELGAVLGEEVAPEPDGEVVDEDEDEPAGAREAPPLSALLQPLITAAPNARETARARVENFMGPPWLGYGKEAARIGPQILRSHLAAGISWSLHRRRRVRALRPGLVAAVLEVAVLRSVLRIDLTLRRVGAFALLGRAGPCSIRRCR